MSHKCLIEGKYIELSSVWTAAKPTSTGKAKDRIWRTRHIGVWFSKREDNWIFLVLIAPLSTEGDTDEFKEDDFKFCVNDSDKWRADEKSLSCLIDWFGKELAEDKGSKRQLVLSKFLDDLFWGWERYLAHVSNDIQGVVRVLMYSCADIR